MKFFLILVLTVGSVFGEVSIESSQNVIIDGVNAGKLCDVVVNYANRRDEIQTAVGACLKEKCDDPQYCKSLLDNAYKCKLSIDEAIAKDVEALFEAYTQEQAAVRAKIAAKKAAEKAQEEADEQFRSGITNTPHIE